jgi:hypothetical protein
VTKVELHSAYCWTCDECGRDNFVRSIVAELSAEDRAEGARQMGCDPADIVTGEWATRPDEVTCQHCGTMFEALDPFPEDPEEI